MALVNNLIWLFKGTELPQQCSEIPSGDLIPCNQILTIFGSGVLCGFLVWPLLDILIVIRFGWQKVLTFICFKLGRPRPEVTPSDPTSAAAAVTAAVAALTSLTRSTGEGSLALRRRGAIHDGAH